MNVIRGNLNTSGKGDHCQMARIGHRHFEKFVVTDFFSWHWILLLAVQNGQIDDNLIMGHNCIVRAILIEQTLNRLLALLQLLFVQVIFNKLRKPICCFFSWCGFFPCSRKLADQKTRKSIDWVDFRLLHYAGEVTYCAVGECEQSAGLEVTWDF